MLDRLRSMRIPLAAAALGMAGLFAVEALADDRDRHEHGSAWGEWGRDMLATMDADGNGSVTSAEVQAYESGRAAEIDADRNGTITVQELDAWVEKQRMERLAEHLARMDGNGDGTVTVEEYSITKIWGLAQLDRDGNGVIEPDEMKRRGWMHHHR